MEMLRCAKKSQLEACVFISDVFIYLVSTGRIGETASVEFLVNTSFLAVLLGSCLYERLNIQFLCLVFPD